MGTRYSRRLVTVAASNDGAMMRPGVRGNKPASGDTVLVRPSALSHVCRLHVDVVTELYFPTTCFDLGSSCPTPPWRLGSPSWSAACCAVSRFFRVGKLALLGCHHNNPREGRLEARRLGDDARAATVVGWGKRDSDRRVALRLPGGLLDFVRGFVWMKSGSEPARIGAMDSDGPLSRRPKVGRSVPAVHDPTGDRSRETTES